MKELVAVLVPILDTILTTSEEKILDHCAKALHRYSLIFVVSEKADVSNLKEKYGRADVITFNEKYFESHRTLSTLFLMEGFYERFTWCDFLLVHELNTWVTKDQLHYWCKQGYDYLRADPAVELGFLGDLTKIRGLNEDQKKIVDRAFEGNGLYLCHIERFLKTLKAKRKAAHTYRRREDLENKDALFAELDANRFWPNLRRPTQIVQTRFSLKVNTEIARDKTDKEAWPFALTAVTDININDLPYFV